MFDSIFQVSSIWFCSLCVVGWYLLAHFHLSSVRPLHCWSVCSQVEAPPLLLQYSFHYAMCLMFWVCNLLSCSVNKSRHADSATENINGLYKVKTNEIQQLLHHWCLHAACLVVFIWALIYLLYINSRPMKQHINMKLAKCWILLIPTCAKDALCYSVATEQQLSNEMYNRNRMWRR